MPFNPDKIITRLKIFNYRFHHSPKNNVIDIYLALFCILRIDYKNGQVKMTARSMMGGIITDRLELMFLIGVLSWFFIFYLVKDEPQNLWYLGLILGLAFTRLIIAFIKIESMKGIIHNWIEKDYNS